MCSPGLPTVWLSVGASLIDYFLQGMKYEIRSGMLRPWVCNYTPLQPALLHLAQIQTAGSKPFHLPVAWASKPEPEPSQVKLPTSLKQNWKAGDCCIMAAATLDQVGNHQLFALDLGPLVRSSWEGSTQQLRWDDVWMDGNTWENCGEDMAQKLYGSPGHIGHLGLLQESCAHTQPGIRCCRILWLNAEAYDLCK